MDKKENTEEIKNFEIPPQISPGFAYFLKKYWKERNNIFRELYKILYDNDPPLAETDIIDNQKNDSEDDLSDLKFYENNKDLFKYFEDKKYRASFDMYNEKQAMGKKKESERENSNERVGDNFMAKTKNTIYLNYKKNYVDKEYKFSNTDFSLSADTEKNIYFRIKNAKIFEINYLIRIKIINDNINEWVFNSEYGLYLLNKIKKVEKPYPIYSKKDEDFEIKTINSVDYFDDLISKGINEFEDLNYEINLEEIISDTRQMWDFQLLKSKYAEIMNINEQSPQIISFKYLNKLLKRNNIYEKFIYIFGSKNYMKSEKILNELIDLYIKSQCRFLYLDFEYINQLTFRSALKKYYAFWLIRAFFFNDFERFKSFYKSINNLIKQGNYGIIIQKLIQYNNENFPGFKLFIILNNVRGEQAHSIIDTIKQYTKNEGCEHNFLVFCDLEDDYNFKKFDEIYMNRDIKLILIPDLICEDFLSYKEGDINDLFAQYDPVKFADLITIFHFSSFLDYKSDNNKNDLAVLSLVKKYIKFLNLIVENDLDISKPIIKNIEFKNKNIENLFFYQYVNYFLNSIETEQKIQDVLNLNDGDFFEKIIILDLITGKIEKNNKKSNFITLEVNSLFGLELTNLELENYKGKDIIFIQKNKTAEIFDFGILIHRNGDLIMKLYQVSTKKTSQDMAKLDVDIIKLHCINISKNLEKLGKIKKFSFGIITSYSCYKDRNTDFKIFEEDCNKKNYELLIYNIKDKKFYIKDEDIKNNNNNIDLSSLESICSMKDINNLDLPNYETLFRLNPKLKTMKYVNKNYIHCIEKYYDRDNIYDDIKIIGKIEYNESFINSSIQDNDLGLLITGYIPGEVNDKLNQKNNALQVKDVNYRIISEGGNIQIYKKDTTNNSISETNEVMDGLKNPNILLYKFKGSNYISKKRNPENLFFEEVLINKKKKKNN